MSKTERALESDTDALENFVATQAEEADRAIDALIDEAVEDPSDTDGQVGGNGNGDAPDGTNGSVTEDDDVVVQVFDTGPLATPDAEAAAALADDEDDADVDDGVEVVDEVEALVDDDEDEIEVEVEAVESDVDDDVEVVDEVEVVDDDEADVDDDEVEALVVDDDAEALVDDDAEVEADVDDDDDEVEALVDDDAEIEADVDDDDADVEVVDDDDAEARSDDDDGDVEALVDDDDSEAYELPTIVPATEDVDDDDADVDADEIIAREGDLDEVSDDILEELRRADIDGPIVDFAPQDDTTSARRRPKRRPDYDPAPIPIPARPPRILGRKPRVRKVTRVVRHVDPWSVFKIAALAFMVLYVILLTAGVLLWNVAYATGTIDNLERFFESFGWSTFEFNGGEIYHASWIAGLFGVIGLTGLAVLAATMFNLITDIVGGMRFTVLEEEVVETRTSPMRRFVVRRPEPEVPAVINDSSGSLIREAVVDDSGAIDRSRG